jgi:hypothetical protein
MGDDPEHEDELPEGTDLDRLMADADPDLATPGEKPGTDDPVEAAKESNHRKVSQELDLTPDEKEHLDRYKDTKKFEGGPVDPDDIKDPKIREAVKQAQQKEQLKKAKEEAEKLDADPDTPVRVDNEAMTEDEPEPEPVSNSEPETPSNDFDDERYSNTTEDDTAADPFTGDDDDVAEAMADWSELTTADEIDPDTFDFEDQDFEKMEGYGDDAVIEFNGLYYHLVKPDDNQAQALFAKMQGTTDQGQMFDLIIEEVVAQPDMSAKLPTWDFWNRAALSGRCMQFLGLSDMGEF